MDVLLLTNIIDNQRVKASIIKADGKVYSPEKLAIEMYGTCIKYFMATGKIPEREDIEDEILYDYYRNQCLPAHVLRNYDDDLVDELMYLDWKYVLKFFDNILKSIQFLLSRLAKDLLGETDDCHEVRLIYSVDRHIEVYKQVPQEIPHERPQNLAV